MRKLINEKRGRSEINLLHTRTLKLQSGAISRADFYWARRHLARSQNGPAMRLLSRPIASVSQLAQLVAGRVRARIELVNANKDRQGHKGAMAWSRAFSWPDRRLDGSISVIGFVARHSC